MVHAECVLHAVIVLSLPREWKRKHNSYYNVLGPARPGKQTLPMWFLHCPERAEIRCCGVADGAISSSQSGHFPWPRDSLSLPWYMPGEDAANPTRGRPSSGYTLGVMMSSWTTDRFSSWLGDTSHTQNVALCAIGPEVPASFRGYSSWYPRRGFLVPCCFLPSNICIFLLVSLFCDEFLFPPTCLYSFTLLQQESLASL